MNVSNIVNRLIALGNSEDAENWPEALRLLNELCHSPEMPLPIGQQLLFEAGRSTQQVNACDALLEQLDYAIAMDKRLSLDILYDLIHTDTSFHWYTPQRVRHLAALLVVAQSTERILDFVRFHVANHHYTDILWYIVHELIVQGKGPIPGNILTVVKDEMQHATHILASLPLARLTLEEMLEPPSFSRTTGARYRSIYEMPCFQSGQSLPYRSRPVTLREITTWYMTAAAVSEFVGWIRLSNARLEMRRYQSSNPIDVSALSIELLLSLNLACLDNAALDSVIASSIPPEWMYRVLFSAFAGGSAYYRGDYGAFGRLRALRMCATMLGIPSFDVQTVATRTMQCSWFSFSSKSDWFFSHAPYNIGLVALDHETNSLTVLAVTDED